MQQINDARSNLSETTIVRLVRTDHRGSIVTIGVLNIARKPGILTEIINRFDRVPAGSVARPRVPILSKATARERHVRLCLIESVHIIVSFSTALFPSFQTFHRL